MLRVLRNDRIDLLPPAGIGTAIINEWLLRPTRDEEPEERIGLSLGVQPSAVAPQIKQE